MTSCSQADKVSGQWQGTPERIMVADAADATSTMYMDFGPRSHGKPGEVVLNSVVEVSQAVVGPVYGASSPYQANITASAQISGTYVTEADDELILSLDPSTYTVTVDPDGVVYTSNIVDGMERPVLDSLTATTAERWKVIITSTMRDRFNQYRKIDDVKVHHGDIMSCEVADRDMTFRRVAQD